MALKAQHSRLELHVYKARKLLNRLLELLLRRIGRVMSKGSTSAVSAFNKEHSVATCAAPADSELAEVLVEEFLHFPYRRIVVAK